MHHIVLGSGPFDPLEAATMSTRSLWCKPEAETGGRQRRQLRPKLEWLEDRRLLATFLVNSTTDAVDANPGSGTALTSTGVITLRSAIMESNALGGNNTITVPAGTYTLSIAGANEDAGATGD